MVEVKIALNHNEREMLDQKISGALRENGVSPDSDEVHYKIEEWVKSKEKAVKQALEAELEEYFVDEVRPYAEPEHGDEAGLSELEAKEFTDAERGEAEE
jgi:hypothetical protein